MLKMHAAVERTVPITCYRQIGLLQSEIAHDRIYIGNSSYICLAYYTDYLSEGLDPDLNLM